MIKRETKYIRLDQNPEVFIGVTSAGYIFISPQTNHIQDLIFQFAEDERIKLFFYCEERNIDVFIGMNVDQLRNLSSDLVINKNII